MHKLAPVIVACLVLVIWSLLSASGAVSAALLPAPADVLARMIEGIANGYLLASAGQTLLVAFAGSFLALIAGVPLGFAITHLKVLSAAIEPYLAASQAIPAVAFAPLLVLWVGYGTTPIVLLCALMVVFPIVINTAFGIRHLDRDVIDAARLDGASRFDLIHRIELPLALPAILSGVRTGFTLSVTGAVVGELVVGGSRGLGIELTTAQHLNDGTGLFATILVLVIIAVSIYGALRGLERLVSARVS